MQLILVLNAGSSSVKFALIGIQNKGQEHDLARGAFDGIGQVPRWSVNRFDRTANKEIAIRNGMASNHKEAVSHILSWIDENYGLASLTAAGHRVVHGGADFIQPVQLDMQTITALRKLVPLAPLHQPHNLAAIDSLNELAPALPQIACFDTAFHATIPDIGRHFALPRAITELGVKRYGFHGLSYNYNANELAKQDPQLAKGRVLVAHLGNGASLCALKSGQSIATTMGFSALDGLMMGTRSGSLDSGVLMYLIERGYTHDQLQDLLYKKCGLLGVSTISADMRKLKSDPNPLAKEAIDLFIYRLIRESGAMIACLGGLDVVSFSGGIGEHDASLRSETCKKLSWLGVELDEVLNCKTTQNQVARISTLQSQVEVWVVPTDEGVMMAQEAIALLHS